MKQFYFTLVSLLLSTGSTLAADIPKDFSEANRHQFRHLRGQDSI